MDTRARKGSVLQRWSVPAIVGGILLLIVLVACGGTAAVLLTPNPFSRSLRTRAFWRHNIAGNRYFEQSDFASAEREYAAMIRLNPNRTDGYVLHGNACQWLNQHRVAIRDYTRAMTLPQSERSRADLYHNRGISHEVLGDYALAIADFDQAIRLNPQISDSRPHRMEALRGAHRDRELIAAASDLIHRGEGDLSRAYELRGHARGDSGDTQGALRDLTEATQIKPGGANLWGARGWYEYVHGDLKGAAHSQQRAVALAPKVALHRFNLGLCLAAAGDEERARAAYAGAAERATANERGAAAREIDAAIKRFPQSQAVLRHALQWVAPAKSTAAAR